MGVSESRATSPRAGPRVQAMPRQAASERFCPDRGARSGWLAGGARPRKTSRARVRLCAPGSLSLRCALGLRTERGEAAQKLTS